MHAAMRVGTAGSSETAILSTPAASNVTNSLNHRTVGMGSVPNYAGENGVPQTVTTGPAPQQQEWSNSLDAFRNSSAQSGVSTHLIGGAQVVHGKPAAAIAASANNNGPNSKQLTTLTTVNKMPQVGMSHLNPALPPTVKQQVQTPAIQPIRLPQAAAIGIRPGGIAMPPGMMLVKNENGQLLMVNSNQLPSSSAASTSTFLVTQSSATGAVTSVKSTSASMVTPTAAPSQVQGLKVTPVTNSITVKNVSAKQQAVAVIKVPNSSTSSGPSQPVTLSQEDMTNVTKCRNFLTTLIKLASAGGQTPETVSNVKKLVQNLIDDKVEPEHFTRQLQMELKSAPQPYLVPFLQRSLPLLRLTMMQQSGGQSAVPPSVAVAAIRASSGATATAAPANVAMNASKVVTLQKRSQAKTKTAGQQNSVPDIRLPRVSTSPSPIHYQGLVAGANSKMLGGRTSIAMMPPPSSSLVLSQKWASPGAARGSFKDDDDINDVASMAGVNLSEESDRILATNSDLVGSQARSCKDTTVVNKAALTRKLSQIVSKHPHVQQLHPDVINFTAYAVEARVKDLIEKVSLVAFHRMFNCKDNEHYNSSQDVKSQLKFLLELDVLEKKRHAQSEREVLMRAMKSRSKNEDPEQLRLKQKAKEMQQLEMERMQIRNADETARNAIGPRKRKIKTETRGGTPESKDFSSAFHTAPMSRPRVRRVNVKDLTFVLEQDKDTNKSRILYKSYLK